MPSNPQRTIFAVDDNEDFCALLKLAFLYIKPHCRLECFFSGQALLDALEVGTIPDLILLDLIMPELDGLETLKRVRLADRSKMIPTIMVSVSNASEDISNCYQEGVNAYLVKPNKFDDLNSMVNLICRYWLETAQLPTKKRPS